MEFCRRHPRRPERGFGLAAVLVTALLMATLLTVLLGANSSTLAVVRHSEGSLLAQSAAESLVARAIYELRHNPEFGCDLSTRLSFVSETADCGKAVLSFDPVEASELGIPVSVNNLSNPESALDAEGDLVPARTARVRAVGTFGKERRTVVMDLHIPPYPYAVATEGSFESTGELSLTGLSPEGGDPIPAHLMANSVSSESLVVGANTHISGDLVSAGGILTQGDNIVVEGEVRPNSSPVEVPLIDVREFDPRRTVGSGALTDLSSSFYRDPTMEGKVVREGNLQLSGQVSLDGALLFVDGDLEIAGELRGRGAIVTTGSMVVNGTQTLTTDNELALLAGGDLSIEGHGVERSKLEGLIYSEGNVEVRDSTIQGTLISQSDGGTTPRVVMERASMIYDPEAVTFETYLGTEETSPSKYLPSARPDSTRRV